MDIRKLSEEERKKYIDGFKQYIANRNGSESIENNQFVNSMVNNATYDAINNTSTRRDYSNYNTTWNRVQNIANDNLNRFSNMQNILDSNTRNEMVKPLEDYTNRKRQSMQNISNAIQERKKQEDKQKEENEKLKSQVNEQFRKKNHSTVDQNQNKTYENQKANIKLANNEEIENANLKRIDTAQFFRTKQDAKTGNVLGYITDKISTGVQSAGDSILNLYATDMLRSNENVRKIGKFLNEEGIDERIDEGNKRILETINNTNYQAKKTGISLSEQDFSEGIQTLGNATESVGAMAPSLVVGAVNPTAGLAVTGITASGSAMKQALDEGATPEQAQRAGVLKGAVEVATEKLFGGVKFFGKGTLDDIFTDKVLNKVSSKIGKFAVRQGYDITGEVVEEHISNIAGYGIDKLVLDKDLPTLKQMIEDADETTRTTILSTLILKSLKAPINSNSLEVNNLTDKQKQDIQKIEKMLQDNDNLSQNNSNLQQNITNNQINPQTGQIINQENKLVQNGNIEQIDSSLANNEQAVYNNTESEGGMNGREIKEHEGDIIDRGYRLYEEEENNQNREYNWKEYNNWEQSINEATTGDTRLSRQRNDTSIQQNSQYGERKYNKQEYNNWEQSIRPKEESNFTIEEKTIKNNIKRQYGKDIVFFDGENTNYNAGASTQNTNTIYINSKQVNEFGLNKTALHETMESNIAHNQTLKQDIIIPAIEKIIDDSNFKQQKEHFWEGQADKIPSDYAIAKDILCDRFAEIKSSESLDYENVLSQETNMTIDYALENFHNQLYGKNMVEQNNINNQLNEIEANTQSLGHKEEIEGKQRKHYKSIMESEQVGEVGKQSAKSLLENDTYRPISNIDTLATANENISRNGIDNTYIAFRSKINSNERITLQDIATGERLIQIFSQNGDYEKVNGLIKDVAMIATELGQNVQALSLIKRMSPEGQLMYLQKVVERTNIKENADLKVSKDMSKRILEAKNETELENVMTDIAVELGSQLPITVRDKLRAWRYLSMLGNPKTHIKNLGANVAMNLTQQTKNKVAGAMEDVVGIFNKDLERTKTLRPANSDQRSFAKQDAEYMKDKIDGGGKYDIKNMIQNNKKQFDNKVLNEIAQFNSNMLELEDNIFLKKAYQQAMQNYMSANRLSSVDMKNSTILQKAREYASYQAQEATFHQFSELARRLTDIENKGGIAGKVLEAVIPFKKTPINIAKSGIEYSPIGLAKSLTYDIVELNKKTRDYRTKLEKGIISEADYKAGVSKLTTKMIDNMAKGLTGTSLAIVGYVLTDMGILKSGNDGEDDEFKEKVGEQEYAVRIGDNTYTLDWVSPSAIPMFVGSTVYDLIHSEGEDNSNTLNSLMTGSAKSLEPMTDMSMLQGLTSAISSYEQGSSNMLLDLGASAISSYFGQFVPTALGQVAKTIDDKERDTSSTQKGLAKKVDQFKKQQMAKIPIVSKMLPVRKDVWGNEKVRDSNALVRAYEVALAPYNKKKIIEDYTNKELLSIFENTGERVLPGVPNKDLTINKQKYRLTTEEYNHAKENFGKTSKRMLDNLVKTNEYKKLSDEQKAEAINNVYSYSKEVIKVNYAKDKKQEVETTSLYNILNELKDPSNQSEYLNYVAKIQGIEKDKEKKQILANGNYSSTTKAVVYKNTLGKEDELYNNVLASDNININEYLDYKLQEFESDKEYDETEKGKAIAGTKKEKVYRYVNNMNITKQQKMAILGTQYKLNYKEERMDLFNYINDIPVKTKQERMEIFRKYDKNFVIYKDGTMSLK